MAWVQVGNRKINTATVCYMDQQEDEKLILHFYGQSTLELNQDESRALWKHLKSEDAMAVKDKGSTMVLPKRWSAAPGDVIPTSGTPAKPLQVTVGQNTPAPAPAAPAAAPAAPSSGQPKPQSGSHSHGHSSSHKPQSSSHSSSGSSSHRPSSSHQPSSSSSSQHRSSSHSHSHSSSSSSKPTDAARVLEFKKD